MLFSNEKRSVNKARLEDPQYYFNRELNLLKFNERILELALDERIPLLERLKFLFISCRNLDEFFEIRVAQLKEQVALGQLAPSLDGLSADETLKQISSYVHPFIDAHYALFKKFLPKLAEIGIRILDPKEWDDNTTAWIKRYFKQEILPIITPIGLDLSHPFPRLINKSLNFIISLEGKDSFGRDSGLAIVHAPRTLPRILKLPHLPENAFVLLVNLLDHYMPELFPGMAVKGCFQFRLTRNSDVFLTPDSVEDLPRALQGELFSRRYGRAVRLEIAFNCPETIIKFLQKKFQLSDDDVYKVDGPVNLSRLMPLTEMEGFSAFRFAPFTPARPSMLTDQPDYFKLLTKQDVILYHPYQSFGPIIDFINQAATDPHVLAIKQTLYRTGLESFTVQALIEAARAGKEVTAVIELRARFDEADNIALANRLQEAGALVVYGILGFKTHAKMTLIVRKEGGKVKRYVHLGTGNYHKENAKVYTDFSLLSAHIEICNDVHKIFLQLTGMGKAFRLKKLIQSPFHLQKKMLELIAKERQNAQEGKSAHIILKMNAITEPTVIQALYRASQAGVKIELIIRGICCLRPGVPGISENIKVRSIVGRFLEHARIYYFQNHNNPLLYCASADWMERNFYYRVEIAFPITDEALAEKVKKDGLLTYLSDNFFSWQLDSDGNYKRLKASEQDLSKSAQEVLLRRLQT